jgi:hypothetical protein
MGEEEVVSGLEDTSSPVSWMVLVLGLLHRFDLVRVFLLFGKGAIVDNPIVPLIASPINNNARQRREEWFTITVLC